jgi:hypothetical protein
MVAFISVDVLWQPSCKKQLSQLLNLVFQIANFLTAQQRHNFQLFEALREKVVRIHQAV